METDEERKRKELRDEAERDAQIAKEREDAQKRHRQEQHVAILMVELRELESTLSRAHLDLNALALEDRQLENTIRTGYRVSSRKDHQVITSEERVIHSLRTSLDVLRADEQHAQSELHTVETELSRDRQRVQENESKTATVKETNRRKLETEKRIDDLSVLVTNLEGKRRDLEEQLGKARSELSGLKVVEKELIDSTTLLNRDVSSESSKAVNRDEDRIQELKLRGSTLHKEINEAERSIAEHERTVDRARDPSRANETLEEKGNSAKRRKEEQAIQKKKLQQKIAQLEQKAEDIKRELTKF